MKNINELDQLKLLSKSIARIEEDPSIESRIQALLDKLSMHDDSGFEALDTYSPIWNTYGDKYEYEMDRMLAAMDEKTKSNFELEVDAALYSLE